ncbi:MAG: phosphoribosylamine--glycine ligase [Clostridiales bacterium]|nr:phosphoribosylamine--glycine ligase [Clostridiales bacterium]
MNILVVGGGGREHAIIKKLRENPNVKNIYALPGNGGISYEATLINISPLDLDSIINYVSENTIDFAVIAPDDPLVLGLTDRLLEKGIPTFGPTKKAAIIEGSKVFSKQLMKKYNIPTADYEIFDNPKDAINYIKEKNRFPIVVKADGLALGKGVLISQNLEEAQEAVNSIMVERAFGDSGKRVVIEEFLQGPEVTVLAFTDSKTIVPMVSSMDHKRALDGDLGLNTGGMGVIAPNPYYTDDIARRCQEEIFIPTINAMNNEDRPFKGCLYFGLMLTEEGPKVIEYNCRFGDPEAQVVLPLLESDLLDIMQAVYEERLNEVEVKFKDSAACCLIAASGGYPKDYKKGYKITGLSDAISTGALIYHAGTKIVDNELVTSGGRVLGVTAIKPTLEDAVSHAYKAMEKIHFENMHYRKDIGKRALTVVRRK